MTKETAELISRLNASRDILKRLNVGDYALIREARGVMADAANGLDSYAKTIALVEKIDSRVVGVLMWLDERARNSASFGSHADAYEIAARRLRGAMHDGTEVDRPLPAENSASSRPEGAAGKDALDDQNLPGETK